MGLGKGNSGSASVLSAKAALAYVMIRPSRRTRFVNGLITAVLVSSSRRARFGSSSPPSVPAISQPTEARTGLSQAERAEFYHLDEGSEVFPLAWFLALENESGTGLFAQDLERFGFIPDSVGPSNPFGLPVGITAADTRDLREVGVKMVGVNCAACHVAELVVNGNRVRVDGAGGRTDIAKFYGALATATVATATNPRKFLAFLERVREPGPSALSSERENSRAEAAFEVLAGQRRRESASAFDKMLESQLLAALDEEMKRPAEPLAGSLVLKPGPAREEAARALSAEVNRGVAEAVRKHVPRTERTESSALARRVGPSEVAPSIAAMFSDAFTKLRLFKARVDFIVRLAQGGGAQATPPGFGRIDAFGGARNLLFQTNSPSNAPVSYPHLWNFERVNWLHWDGNTTSVLERNIGQALGLGALLDRTSLASTVSVYHLHRLEGLARKIQPPRWADKFGPIDEAAATRGAALFTEHCASCHASGGGVETELGKIGTDPLRARNFAAPVNNQPNDRAIAELIGGIKRKAFDERGFTEEERRILDGDRKPIWRTTSHYVARPLIAPWATAPFLHNNSVPTLADLLLPPDQRPVQFFVGSSEYDTARLGFVTSERPGSFPFETKTPGNSNAGHNYGTNLSSQERSSLLEYLKKF